MIGRQKRDGKRQKLMIWRGCYRAGWDAALIGKHTNPYTRSDNASAWKHGHDDCTANKKPPVWLVTPEWVLNIKPAPAGGEARP